MDFDNIRVPVIALPYSESHKAMQKELLIDYNNGNIYVVSATDKNVIFDVTSKISEQLKNMDPSNMKIYIDGIGIIDLKTLLNTFKLELDDTIKLEDTSEDAHYIKSDISIDDKSLEISHANIQIAGYIDAPDFSVPQRYGDTIRWMPVPDLLAGQGIIIGDGDNTSTGNTGIDIPYSYLDGNIKQVPILEPNNYNIFLSSGLQKSKYMIDDGTPILIHLPVTLDDYSRLRWLVQTNSNAPILEFMSTIIWKTENFNLVKDSYHIFEFETWDNGTTWFGNVDIYSN